MDGWYLLGELIALLALALTFGTLAERLKQRPIVGYLLAGLLAGPNGFSLVRGRQEVEFLAELGVTLLLFSIGLEFSWQRISALGSRTALAATLQFVLTAGAGYAAGILLGLPAAGCFVIGGMAALSSTAFVLRLLEERSEMDSRHGRVAVGILLLQDLLLVPLLIIQSVLAEGREGWQGLAQFLVQIGKGAALVALFYVIIRLFLLRVWRGRGSYADRDIPVLLSLLVCTGCSWATHLAGLSPVLGAFVGGAMLGDQPIAHQIRSHVSGWKTVFITLFFTSIGMLAGIPTGVQALLITALALTIMTAKAALGACAIRFSGHTWRVAMLGGFAIAQIGEFSFVLATDGFRRKALPEEWFHPVMTASVLTLAATPYALPLSQRLVGRWRFRPEEEASAAPDEPVDAIVVGYGPAGREVVEHLVAAGHHVTVIDSNPALLKDAASVHPVIGDATNPEILDHAGIQRCRSLVITTPDPAVARTILNLAHTSAPQIQSVVRARYHLYAEPLRQSGAGAVLDEELAIGRELAQAAAGQLRA